MAAESLGAVAKLLQIFPNVDSESLGAVLEASGGNVEKAVEVLLDAQRTAEAPNGPLQCGMVQVPVPPPAPMAPPPPQETSVAPLIAPEAGHTPTMALPARSGWAPDQSLGGLVRATPLVHAAPLMRARDVYLTCDAPGMANYLGRYVDATTLSLGEVAKMERELPREAPPGLRQALCRHKFYKHEERDIFVYPYTGDNEALSRQPPRTVERDDDVIGSSSSQQRTVAERQREHMQLSSGWRIWSAFRQQGIDDEVPDFSAQNDTAEDPTHVQRWYPHLGSVWLTDGWYKRYKDGHGLRLAFGYDERGLAEARRIQAAMDAAPGEILFFGPTRNDLHRDALECQEHFGIGAAASRAAAAAVPLMSRRRGGAHHADEGHYLEVRPKDAEPGSGGAVRFHVGPVDLDLFVGSEWRALGREKPLAGTAIDNEALSAALLEKVRFTREEFERLQVRSLQADSFIKSGDAYFGLSTFGRDPSALKVESKRVPLGFSKTAQVEEGRPVYQCGAFRCHLREISGSYRWVLYSGTEASLMSVDFVEPATAPLPHEVSDWLQRASVRQRDKQGLERYEPNVLVPLPTFKCVVRDQAGVLQYLEHKESRARIDAQNRKAADLRPPWAVKEDLCNLLKGDHIFMPTHGGAVYHHCLVATDPHPSDHPTHPNKFKIIHFHSSGVHEQWMDEDGRFQDTTMVWLMKRGGTGKPASHPKYYGLAPDAPVQIRRRHTSSLPDGGSERPVWSGRLCDRTPDQIIELARIIRAQTSDARFPLRTPHGFSQREYRNVGNNCEHFCVYCITGVKKCEQWRVTQNVLVRTGVIAAVAAAAPFAAPLVGGAAIAGAAVAGVGAVISGWSLPGRALDASDAARREDDAGGPAHGGLSGKFSSPGSSKGGR